MRKLRDGLRGGEALTPMAETNSCDLLWLVGQRLQSVSVTAESWWSFHFDEHCSISTYGPWRLIEEGRIRVTSEDHGHPFGLPAPVDAVERVATSSGRP